jgi:serine/threonine protein kinase
MKLHVGERLRATGPANQPGGYVVTGVIDENPWSGLYAGKKIYYNFDFTGKRPRETDDNEWLDVLLRTVGYPVLDDPSYVAGRRDMARAEARHVLGNRSSNLWPEPIDLLDVVNTRDPFTFSQDGKSGIRPVSQDEPIIIFAHPHGQALSEWQEGVLPLASLLAVLAEVLEFMRQAHEGGMLLNGLGPSSIIVDRAGRVHYVGTEMVVADPERGDSIPDGTWSRFFPPERYPRGFSAPECFDANPAPQKRSDLYGWGSLTYCLLTGDSPSRIAKDQDRPWALFGDQHLGKLERSLRSVPPAHVKNWGEQLGVQGATLLDGWPGNFLAVLRLLLHPDIKRRPESVAELRSWILLPPPPPVSAILALRTGPKAAKIYFDLREPAPGAELIVRRGAGGKPMTAAEETAFVTVPPLQSWMIGLSRLPDPSGIQPSRGSIMETSPPFRSQSMPS